ncbi:MAG: 2-oxo acid dehydrogenase subunit E2, partial [Sulfuritalea sp.]|nr:2-oxo acid dehydrogenase subunit E2 [Sulfuritalea sp.]
MIDFKLPSLGADMDEGTLLEWKVKPGDAVKKGQVVCVVDTVKAAVDVECWQEGTVAELLAEVGRKMPVGTVMARLLEGGEPGIAVPMLAAERLGAVPMLEAGRPSAVPPAPTFPPRRMISPAARK